MATGGSDAPWCLFLAHRMSTRNPSLNILPRSVLGTLKNPDYSPWQRRTSTKKQSLTALPPLVLPERKKEEKKTGGRWKAQDKRSVGGRAPGFDLKAASSVRLKPGWTQTVAKDMKMAKSLENIKILQRMSRSKTFSLEELKRHTSVLLEKNKELVQKIEEMDADTAKQARDLLQQYDLFGAIIATLQDSNQSQAGVAKADYLATEKAVEKNMGKLELEAKRMQSKVHALQEEVNVLRTYMDKEYPVKAVQISSLMRSIRKQKEEQQDELEDMEDLSKRFLESLAEKAREEQDCILQAVAEEKLMQYQDGLKQMNRNNLELKRQIKVHKEVIDELMREIGELHKSLIMLQHSVGDPRDTIFADVLLRRPKCTPEMEVVLSIPTDDASFL